MGSLSRSRVALASLVFVGLLSSSQAVLAKNGSRSSRPRLTGSPVLSGTAVAGATLQTSAGTWSGAQPITYAYRWMRCASDGASCASTGVTSPTYSLTASDVGSTL